MKTTLEIPDAIFRRAKTVAAERGIPFRALVWEAPIFMGATQSVFVQ
jgi:hypothetical protein